MVQNLRQLWQFRYFWTSLVKMDLILRYRRSFLGIGWSLMHPIAMTAVFCIIFSNWLEQTDWRSSAPYFLAGIAIWEYVSQSITGGTGMFLQNESFIRQCPLPMAIYPLRTVLGTSIHFGITLGVVVGAIALLTPTGVDAVLVLWSVLPALLLLFLFCWSACVLAGYVNVFFEDTKHILEVVFRIGFFLTPILYRMEWLEKKGMTWIADYNPVVLFFDLIRTPLLTGEPPALYLYGNAALLVAVLFGLAVASLAWMQKKLIFHL